MKQVNAFFFALLASAPAAAQITITSIDMPAVGDALVRYTDTVPTTGPGTGGALQTWDLSAAAAHLTATTDVVDPASTAYATSFPNANAAMTTDGLSYLYFNNSVNSVLAKGSAGDILGNGLIITAVFSPDLTVNEFPRTYGSGFDDTYGFESVVDGSAFGVYQAKVKRVASVMDTTDGYGTVLTPIGGYDCLRSKNTSYSVDSVWIKLLAFLPWTFATAIVDTTVSYSWWAHDTKLPVAEMTMDSLGNPLRLTYSAIAPGSTAINAGNVGQENVPLFPQPAQDRVRLALASDELARIRSVDMICSDGRLAKRLQKPTADGWMDVGGLPAGSYQLRLDMGNGVLRTATLLRAD